MKVTSGVMSVTFGINWAMDYGEIEEKPLGRNERSRVKDLLFSIKITSKVISPTYGTNWAMGYGEIEEKPLERN